LPAGSVPYGLPSSPVTLPSPDLLIKRLPRLPERYLNALLLVAILALFITFNKAAFQSYFSDDDFSNLALVHFLPWRALPTSIFTPALIANVRPLGVVLYKILDITAGFHFAVYVAVLQLLHVSTALMLWFLLRRLGFRSISAALGFAFFLLHMSTLPAYWKPMYLFDVLCGFWVMAALLFYRANRFFLSLLCAWLAFKSKEMELMLPVVLLLYEWQFGDAKISGRQQWVPLVPFFLMSLSFGLQSVMLPPGPESAYTMHLNAAALWSGAAYYGTKLLYAPLCGLIISVGLLFLQSRVIAFGVLAFWALIFPMFGFPGRQFGAYLYVPLLAFSIAVAAVAQLKPWWAVLFLVFWIPASYDQLKTQRSALLAYRYEHMPYVAQVRESLASNPAPEAVVYEGAPVDFNVWGQEGLFTYALDKHDLPVFSITQPQGPSTLRRSGTVLYAWDVGAHRLHTTRFPGEGHEMSYVDFAKDNPIWQLKAGWNPLLNACRPTAPRSLITLRQPAGDTDFAIKVYVPDQAENLHQTVRVFRAGQTLGAYRFAGKGLQTLRLPVSSSADAVEDFEMDVDPPVTLPSGHRLGMIVCACGFVPRNASHTAVSN
jgi:hypothetical protein